MPLGVANRNMPATHEMALSLDALLETVCKFPGYLLFFLMLFIPCSLLDLKTWLVGITVPMCMFNMSSRKNAGLHPSVAGVMTLLLVTGAFFTFLGANNNTPGWRHCGKVYVLFPLVYIFLIGGGLNRTVIRNVFRIMVLALIAIGVYSAIHVLHALGYYPSAWYVDFVDENQLAVTISKGYAGYALMSITSLIFLIPFALAALVYWGNAKNAPLRNATLWLAILCGIGAALLSGRRALWLVSLFSPLIILVSLRLFSSREALSRAWKLVKMSLLFFVCVLVVLATATKYLDITYEGIWYEKMATIVDELGGDVHNIRAEQSVELLKAWSENPILGNGLGTSLTTMVRNSNRPWSYELSYHALLNATGIVGFAIYGGVMLWIYWMGAKVIRSGGEPAMWMFPVLIGMTCFLMANGTNPYLERFESLWVVFLPLGIINYWACRTTAAPVRSRT